MAFFYGILYFFLSLSLSGVFFFFFPDEGFYGISGDHLESRFTKTGCRVWFGVQSPAEEKWPQPSKLMFWFTMWLSTQNPVTTTFHFNILFLRVWDNTEQTAWEQKPPAHQAGPVNKFQRSEFVQTIKKCISTDQRKMKTQVQVADIWTSSTIVLSLKKQFSRVRSGLLLLLVLQKTIGLKQLIHLHKQKHHIPLFFKMNWAEISAGDYWLGNTGLQFIWGGGGGA